MEEEDPTEEKDPEEDPEEELLEEEDPKEEQLIEEDLDEDPVEEELEPEVTRWKGGRCGRMCHGTCPMDAPVQ